MHPGVLRSKLSGVIAFPVTPFKEDLSLDLPALHQNLTHLMQYQISALVVAGGTGEIYSLTPAEYIRVIELTALAVEDRVPVIAGVGFGQRLAVEMAQAAEKAGADGILAFPPYYTQAEDDGLIEYYRAIGEATHLGMLIYSRDWASFSPSMVERLTAITNLIGWKDGHGDIRRLQMIINHVGDRLHWIGGAGDDLVAAYFSIGVTTFTSSIATVAPRLSLRLWELADAGDSEALTDLLDRCVIPLYALRARRKGYEVSAMKTMMDMVGLNGGPVRPPLVNLRPDEEDELRTILASWEKFL
ncbi:MAG TPA: 5-dehydro-4-deoxyglucarate dehydratase [Pyrinomonadaceae bacterium]|jgi:5-dehydro-4-deoxyglucarate dehydratase|nr:5-dehydro-4-deoxyglucarate dehydratase [Pyrinomonadaceae bacterium]